MNTHINVPRAGEEIMGTSLGSSTTHVPSISTAQAVTLLFLLCYCSSVQPILETDSETLSVSAAHVSVFTKVSLTAVSLTLRVTKGQQYGITL